MRIGLGGRDSARLSGSACVLLQDAQREHQSVAADVPEAKSHRHGGLECNRRILLEARPAPWEDELALAHWRGEVARRVLRLTSSSLRLQTRHSSPRTLLHTCAL